MVNSDNIREVLCSWRYGETLTSLQGLISSTGNSVWTQDLYKAAERYLKSESWLKYLPKFAKSHLPRGIFDAHAKYLSEILSSEEQDNLWLSISFDDVHEPIYLGTGRRKNIRLDEFVGKYILVDEFAILNDETMKNLAAAITLSLPVFPKALSGLEVDLTRSGCYIRTKS